MGKSGWKRRLMAGLLCTALVFQNLSISASAETGGAGSAVEMQEEDIAQETQSTEDNAQETQPQESGLSQETQPQENDSVQQPDSLEDNAAQEDYEQETDAEEEQELALASESGEDPSVVEDPDKSTVKMIDDGSITGTGTREIKDVDRNNAKWITFNPGKAGDYYIYTTNDGTNAHGDPMVVIFTEKRASIEKKDDGTIDISQNDADVLYGDNNDGHKYQNFYRKITVTDESAQYFIFAGSESSKTSDQTVYTLHVEREEPVSGGDASDLAADKTAAVSDVSEYRYRWLVFRAPADGIYKFETVGDQKADGTVKVYAEKKEDAAVLAGESECVTIPEGRSVYIRAFASDSSGVADRLPFDTVSFDVQAVTVAKADSFALKFYDIQANQISYRVDYTGKIDLVPKYTIEYKKRGAEEAETITGSTNGVLNNLEPGTAYDVTLYVRSDACVEIGTAEEPKSAAIMLTESFTTKTLKPAEYNQTVKAGAYTLQAAVEEITGGFRITGLKVTKATGTGDNDEYVRIKISYKEASAAENDAHQSIGQTKSVTIGQDMAVSESEGWSVDGLYLGSEYLLNFELLETGTTETAAFDDIRLNAGAWPSDLNPEEEQGYQLYVLDFSQIAVKPQAVTVWLADGDTVSKSLTPSKNDKNIYAYRLTESDISNMEAPCLILEVEDENGHKGLKKLSAKPGVLSAEDIDVAINKTDYNEDESGMNASVTISADVQALPNLAAKADFTTGSATKSSRIVPLDKDGKAGLVIPELSAGAEGTITVTIYEDQYLGMHPDQPDYAIVLKAFTPQEADAEGAEKDKIYTVGESKLYTIAFEVDQDNIAIDNVPYTITVSKLALGGSVQAAIEYAAETKADEENGITAVDAITNLTDGMGLTGTRHIFYFDEGKDPAEQLGSLTGLAPDCNYAYRVKLYNANGTLLRVSSEVKTFRTKDVTDLTILQSVEGKTEDQYKTITLKAKFNVAVDTSKLTVKYREIKAGTAADEWETASAVTGWKTDRIDSTLIYADFDISGMKAGARYEWLVTEYRGESVEGKVSGTKIFEVPIPALTVVQKSGSYDVTLTLSSDDIKDYIDETGHNLILYYTDKDLDPSSLTSEENSIKAQLESRTIGSAYFTKNVYTQKQEAEVDIKGLKADTGYSYAIYIDDGNYVCLVENGRFRTTAALAESDFSVVNTEKSDGYNQIWLTFSYAKAPEGIDIEKAVESSESQDFEYVKDFMGRAYAKGLIVTAKKSDGAETPAYTQIARNIDLENNVSDISVDSVNHTITMKVNYANLKSWLGETGTDFYLLSEISVQPYITVRGGEEGNKDLVIKATEFPIRFQSLASAKVDQISIQSVNTIGGGVELTVKGTVSPIYLTDGTLYAFAEYRAIVDGAPTEPELTNRVAVEKRTGSFTIGQNGLDYASEYMVNLYIVTENKAVGWKTDDNGAKQALDTDKYANCSGAKRLDAVQTKEDYVAAIPNNVKSSTAEILVWTRKGSVSGYAVAVASKESNPALYQSDTPDDFDNAVRTNNKITGNAWSASYGIDASNDAFLSGVKVTNLLKETDYVYAVAKLVDGKYKYIAGGGFTTAKYDDSTLFDDWGYHFYPGDITDTTASFYAVIAPKYMNYKNYRIEITYYKEGDANSKKTAEVAYTGPTAGHGQEIRLEGLTPATAYIVEKVEILDVQNRLLGTYTTDKLNFTTLEKAPEGTFMESSGVLEMIEGTLRTDGFKVRAGFTYEEYEARSPFQICVYEGDKPVYTVRDIPKGTPVDGYAEVIDDEGNKVYRKIYKYTIDNAAVFTGLKPNQLYTVKGEMLADDGSVTVLAETVITTLEDIEYDLGADAVIKDASLRKHVIDALVEKGLVFQDLKIKRSEIEAANITRFTVNEKSVSRETPPVKTLEGLEILGQLTSLTVSHQDLENADAAGKLVELESLNLSFNCLTSVPDLRSCTDLTSLDIRSNKIAAAAFDSVQGSDGSTYYRNMYIAHIHNVRWENQRQQSYGLEVRAFDTIKDVDLKLEASVSGYRTDRNYKAVVTVDDKFSETIYAAALSDTDAPGQSKLYSLINKQVTLPAGSYTMKVVITSEEEYNFGSGIASLEGTFIVNPPVAFADPVLEAAVKALCIEEEKAAADITELRLVKSAADSAAITSLDGIKVLERLETLVVRGHALKDAGPVAELEHIKKVDLSHNVIETVPDFALKELYYLDLSYNALTAIPNLERCSRMIENTDYADAARVLDYRWNFISYAEEVFIRTNYRIPEYFRYLNGWLAKQAMCQREEGESSDLLLEITDSTFSAIGEKLNVRIVVDGLEYGSHNTFKMIIRENGKAIGTATGVYVPEKGDAYPYHYFKFTDLPLSDGQHTLTFEITSPSAMPDYNANNYGTVGAVEQIVTVRRNVIADKALRDCLTEETAEITDIYGKKNNQNGLNRNLAIDEIREFIYTGQAYTGTAGAGREPVRSLTGIRYMTALVKFDLSGNELANTADDDWFAELAELSGIAPDQDAQEGVLAKVNLSYNNLTTAPEGIDVDVDYNLIDTDVEIADTQRKYQITNEGIYYRVSDRNTTPLYIEAEGLKITDNDTEYRTYQFELSCNNKVIATIDRQTGTAPNNGYRKIKEASRLGIYVADTKLADGEHTLKLTATDDLGQKVEYGEFTVTVSDPITWASLSTEVTTPPANGQLPTTDDEIQVSLSAPYLNTQEQFESLTLTLTPENAAEIEIGTYSPNGSPAVLTSSDVWEKLYNSRLFENMPESMRTVKKVQFSGKVNIRTPLEEAFYTVAVKTTAGRTLKAEKVRFGLDGKRYISGVKLSEAYDSTGDSIYIEVDGFGLDFDQITPVLYSREHVELTDTATADKAEVHQVSGNNYGQVIYKLAKLHKPIWEGDIEDDVDALFTQYDSNNDGRKDAEGIRYEILYDEDYELQPDYSSHTDGYITGYKQKNQSISENGFVIYNAAFNYMTGQLEVVLGEKASSDAVTLVSLTSTTGGGAIANAANLSTVVKNGVAYFDLTSCDIPEDTYQAVLQNNYDNNATNKTGTYNVTFPEHYKGPTIRNNLTTWGNITTYVVEEDADGAYEEDTQFFEEGTTRIGFRVTLNSDVYNHLEAYRLHLEGTGENGKGINVTADKYFYLSAPDESGSMTASGIIETDSPLTVGGNTNNQNNSYKITLQHRDAGTSDTYTTVKELHTDINDNKNQAGSAIASDIYVYAPYEKTKKVLASAIRLDDEKKTLTITTNNADELDTSGFNVRLTYLDGEMEDKAVSEVTRAAVHDNWLVLDLSDILAGDACWIDVLYAGERLYYQYIPERFYGEAVGVANNNGHDAYYQIHERLRFLSVADYGYYYGCEGTEGGLSIRIADVTDTQVYRELTTSDTVYEFTAKDLKGLDLSKVYRLTATDQSGNILTVSGNIAPKEGTAPKSIKLNKTTVKLNSATSDTVQLAATVSGGDKEIVWRSTNPAIATVDQNGLVRAVANAQPYTTTIEAVSRYGDGQIKAECEVEVHRFSVRTVDTVAPANALAALTLDSDAAVQQTLTLRATWDGDADAKFVEYTTTDTTVINIKDGIVTPIGVGSAVIKAERDGYTAYCNVTVNLPVKGAVIVYDVDGKGTYRDVETVTLVNGHGSDTEYRLDWKPSPAGVGKPNYQAYFSSSRPDLVAVEEYRTDQWHLVPVAPTEGEEVVITLTVAKKDEAAANQQNRTIVATDTMKVTVLGNLNYPEKLCPDVPDIVTVYTDIVSSGKRLTLGDVALPEGWRWTDDTSLTLYEGTITEFEAIYELDGYAPETRKRGSNPVKVWVGKAREPQINYERYGRMIITRTADTGRSGLALNVSAGNVSADSAAVLDAKILHYTLNVTNEEGLDITFDTPSDERNNPQWFYVEAGSALVGEQTVTASATYECEWIYDKATEEHPKYETWNSAIVLTTEQTYRVVEGSVVDTVRLERTNKDGKTELVRRLNEKQTLASGTEYIYTLTAYDQWGAKLEDAQFAWMCEDGEVLSVSGSGLTADVTTYKGGKTKLAFIAEDDGAYTYDMDVWVVNAEPHIEGTKASVNTAVDYEQYPEMGEVISIIPAYDQSLVGTPVITIDNSDDAAVSDKFELYFENEDGKSNRQNREIGHVIPKKGAVVGKSDSGNYYIRTATDAGYYFSPVKITVTTKKPSVSIAQKDKVNLFYKHDTGTVKVSVKGDLLTGTKGATLDKLIEWSSEPEDGLPGFVLDAGTVELVKGRTEYEIHVIQQAIELDAKNKLTDKNLTKGTLRITIPGYKEPVIKTFTIGTIYKAPVYTIYGTQDLFNITSWEKYTAKGKAVMCPGVGWSEGRTIVRASAADQEEIKDQLRQNDTLVMKSDSNTTDADRLDPLNRVILYDYITWTNKTVDVKVWNNTNNTNDATDYLDITTTSAKGLSDTLEFHSSEWRGTVKTKLSLQMVKPTLALEKSTITVNKNYTAETYNYNNNNYSTKLTLKNFVKGIGAAGISIKGDKKSQPFLDSGVLQVTCTTALKTAQNKEGLPSGGVVQVKISNDEALKRTLTPGSYKFTLTPYIEQGGSQNQGLQTFKSAQLTVKVVDKEAQAKASVKGKLDLLKVYGYNRSDEIDETQRYKDEFKNLIKDSYVELNTKFANIDIENDPIGANGYGVKDVKLIGEYADQFTIECLTEHTPTRDIDHYIIRRSDRSYESYDESDNGSKGRKLFAKESYKLQAVYTLRSGIEITSNVFTIKPVQSVPKIAINIKAAELYASSTGERNAIALAITVPEGYGYNYKNSIQNNSDENDLFGRLDIKCGNDDDNRNYAVYQQTAWYDRTTGATTLYYRFNIDDGRGAFVKTTNKGVNSKLTFTYELYGRDRKSKDASGTIKLTVKR